MTSNTGLIFVVGHEKGGVAKSTCACNLAYSLKQEGYEAIVVDTDSTRTSHSWYAIREAEQRQPSIPVVQSSVSPMSTIKEMSTKYDVVVVDMGARDYGKMGPLAQICDLWIAPTQVGQGDLESTVALCQAFQANDSKHKNGKIPLVCVFTRTPNGWNNPEERIAREDLKAACPDLTILNSSLRDRKVYRDAGRTGCSIYEMPARDREKAVEEFDAFVREATKYVSHQLEGEESK
jgi:chromosome partitioning protein